MLRKTLVTHTGLGLLLLAMACGDDAKRDDEDPTGSVNPDSGPVVSRQDGGGSGNGNGGKMDAGLGLDGAVIDDDTDPVVTLPDGAVVGGDNGDAATTTPSTPDASIDSGTGTGTGTGADASADTGTTTPPVTTPVTDAGTNPPVTTPDAGDCSIKDPAFGCGTAVTPTWIRFDNGYEADRDSGLVWAPAIVPANLNDLSGGCFPVSVGGTTHIFDVPMMDQVRTLAAGCPQTLPSGSCGVETDEELPSANNADCTCAGGTGPHASGGFCRPEVGSCETIWTRTYCGPNDTCSTHQPWFYDVSSGSIVLKEQTDPFAAAAKVRCVTRYLPVP